MHTFVREEGRLALTVDLPGVASLDSLEVDIGDTELRIAGIDGGADTVCITLPQGLSAGEAVAKFSRRRAQLVIAWPGAAPCSESAAADADAGAAPLQAAADSDAADADTGAGHGEPRQAESEGRDPGSAPAAAGTPQATRPRPTDAAYGSLWNANSWHWEERNCLDLVRAEVRAALSRCEGAELRHIRQLAGACVLVKDVEVSGEAGMSVRKGKRILCFEVSVNFRWDCRDEFGQPLGAKGTGRATGITQEEGEDPPAVEVDVSALSSGGREAKAAGEWMRRQGAAAIGAALLGETLAAAVLAADVVQANPEADRARREEERRRAEEARRVTDEARARIAEEQRAKETAGREAMAARKLAVITEVKGSVWNVNAWHWEERPMTEWAKAWFEKALSGLSIDMLGGVAHAMLQDCKVSGDASVSVRKGKPITLFVLHIECAWSARTEALGAAEGTLRIPEFSSEDGAENCALHTAARKDSSSGRLTAAFRKEGVARVRVVLADFVASLRAQIQRPDVAAVEGS